MAALPTGLDASQRTQLERLVNRARATLETDLASQAEGRFGIHSDGTIEEEQDLSDDASGRTTRRELVEIIDHIRTLGESQSDAVARLLREATFTHLNRLLAIRIAEAIDLLPESLANGQQSRGFRDLGEIMPVLAEDYWGYLLLCGDELSADAPALFDPRNPLLALAPSTPAFDEIVALLSDSEAVPLWLAPDALGWAYQFFNTGDERRAMREESAPRSSRELAVRNQFFTPRYVVDFLVQNTLGRRLIENDPTSPLLGELSLLVDPPTAPGPALDLNETTVLDPACGSGHFLLGCYDLLERAWELRGVPPSESAPAIVASLWGVDIDPRCAQVASAAIVLRARRHCRDLPIPRPNIVTARSLPSEAPALDADLGLTPDQRSLVERISEVLADAPLLGVLLKVEDALEQEIRHATFGGDAATLPLTEDAFSRVEADLMSHLQAVADQASSSVGERLLAAEADDALRLVELVRNQYDVVLMNPPFGEPVPSTKAYLKSAYPWVPAKDANLFAAFVGRGVALCRDGGYVGAITSRAGMFNTTYQAWREQVFLGHQLTAVADLGGGVMEQAMVEAAAYVIGHKPRDAHRPVPFIRLLDERPRAAALQEAIEHLRQGADDERVYRVTLADLEAIPGHPVAYWMHPSLRELFQRLAGIEGQAADVRIGTQTGDDFRFLRCAWEVRPSRVARTREDTHSRKRWVAFAKGGEYSPYWSDVHLVLDWEHDGEVLRAFPGSRVQNTKYMFGEGVTWPRRTQGGFNPSVLPPGCAFGDKGPGVFARPGTDPLLLLAWLNSRPARCLLDAVATFGSYEVGAVQRVPWPGQVAARDAAQIVEHARVVASAVQARDEVDETTRSFVAPELSRASGTLAQRLESWYSEQDSREVLAIDALGALESDWARALGFDTGVQEYIEKELGVPVWELSDQRATGDQAVFLAEGVAAPAGSFTVSPALEPASRVLGLHPRRIAEARKGFPPDTDVKRRAAVRLASWLVGVAVGRWDASALKVQEPFELVEPLPISSPGELVGSSSKSILIDEPGHDEDIVEGMRLAAMQAFGDGTQDILDELSQMLGARDLRAYMSKTFFRDHLAMYTKSRRKAPIYWPLTVPSRKWGVWLYAPTLSRETLYAVASEAARRERFAVEAIARLQRAQQDGADGGPARKIAEDLDSEEELAEELRRFRTEAERIAGLGWEPDLDDGIVLCAAPLADLFPGWRDAAKKREELRSGRYEWATVAKWARQL